MRDLSDDELLAELGVEAEVKKTRTYSAEEERVIAGFEDICRFIDDKGRAPRHGDAHDIFERLYAVRLGRLRESKQWRDFLQPFDTHHLLIADAAAPAIELAELDDDALLNALGAEAPETEGIANLQHVRPAREKSQPDEIASRKPCADFASFSPLFEAVRNDFDNEQRQTRRFGNNADIKKGEFFVLNGQMVYVADIGESFKGSNGSPDARLRVIYDNGTESDILLRSLQRALYKDDNGRRVTEPDAGPLFSNSFEEGDEQSGTIYVLRSDNSFPFIVEHRDIIHKIGVTGGSVEKRIANAALKSTFLMADVEVVATYKLSNINCFKLETLLHRIFADTRLDIDVPTGYGSTLRPQEWFLVPLPMIDEAVEKIRAGTIANYRYDHENAKFVAVQVRAHSEKCDAVFGKNMFKNK